MLCESLPALGALRFLSLNGSEELGGDAEALRALAAAVRRHPTVRELKLQWCGVTDAGLRALHPLAAGDPPVVVGLLGNPLITPAARRAAEAQGGDWHF